MHACSRNAAARAALLATALVLVIAASPADKVQAMRAAIESAGSLAEVRAAYLKIQPSPADLERLASLLRGTPLEAKLGRLGEQAKNGRASAPGRRPSQTVLVDVSARLASANAEARRHLAAARPAPASARRSEPVETSPFTPELERLARLPSSSPDAPRIMSFLPLVIEVGGSFRVSGRNFGNERGTVRFGLREPRIAVNAEITRWSDSLIEGTVPLDVDRYLAQNARNDALAWIQPHAEGARAIGKEVDLRPLAPRIASLSSREILPGQDLAIRGSHFGERPGRVEFDFGGRRFIGETSDASWTGSAVGVRLPDIDGLVAQTGRLHLETELGRTTSFPVSFVPIEATMTFWDTRDHHYTPATHGPSGQRELRELIHHPELARPLENQWVLESAEISTTGDGSCRYTEPPVLNSNRVPVQLVLRPDAYDTVVCTSTVVIRGPRNTAFSR